MLYKQALFLTLFLSMVTAFGLTITANFATEISDAKYQAYTTEKYIYATNSASITDTRRAFALNEDIVNYKAEVGDHSFDLMGMTTSVLTLLTSM